MIELSPRELASIRHLLREALMSEQQLESRLSHLPNRKRSKYLQGILDKLGSIGPAPAVIDTALHIAAIEAERVTAQPAEAVNPRQIAKQKDADHVV